MHPHFSIRFDVSYTLVQPHLFLQRMTLSETTTTTTTTTTPPKRSSGVRASGAAHAAAVAQLDAVPFEVGLDQTEAWRNPVGPLPAPRPLPRLPKDWPSGLNVPRFRRLLRLARDCCAPSTTEHSDPRLQRLLRLPPHSSPRRLRAGFCAWLRGCPNTAAAIAQLLSSMVPSPAPSNAKKRRRASKTPSRGTNASRSPPTS